MTADARIKDAVSLLVQRARAGGDIHGDIDPTDVLRALFGITYGAADLTWETSARRLIDIVIGGLRTHSAGSSG